ncbi:MAG TPA: DUF222 domain-containing protein [Streptosporangiaceae bacterium]|jgi:hypothetical protein
MDVPEGAGHAALPDEARWVPGNAAAALAAVRAGLGWLARADAASLPGEVQADCLRGLEQAESVLTAARGRVLAAFNAQGVFEADGSQGCKPWLAWQTRVTGGAALGAMGWMRRLAVHPLVAGALGRGEISESWAKQVCSWSDRLQPELRQDADQILLGAAAGGAGLADLSGLAEEMYRRSAPPDADDRDDGFGDRNVSLDLHFRGAGKLDGDLTPACAAALTAVLESLGKKAGPEDDRTAAQRRHDALEEACRRLVASGMLPDVAGQPTLIQLHMTLDQLRGLPGAAEAERNWLAERLRGDSTATPWSAGTGPAGTGPAGTGPAGRGRADAGRAAATGGHGDWLAGRAAGDGEPGWAGSRAAAEAYACDAQIAPVVTGHLDPAVLAAMTRDYLDPGHYDAILRGARRDKNGWRRDAPPDPRSIRRVQDTLLRYAADVLSGPAGLAAFLRTGMLAADLPATRWPGDDDTAAAGTHRDAGSGSGSSNGSGSADTLARFPASVSLPLDTGAPTPTVPPHLRRAVTRRDRRCAFPGCRQRPQACQVHHVIPRSRGGPTALWNLVLLCPFHHLIAIHRRGWKLSLNADGTTTATSPDGIRTLHSHGPPAAAA